MLALIAYSITIGPLCSWMVVRSSVVVFWTSLGGNILGMLFIVITVLMLIGCSICTVELCAMWCSSAVEENANENREGIIL